MRPQYQPHSFCSEDVMVQSCTGLKLSDVWDAVMDGPRDYRWEDEYGVIRSLPVTRLRYILTRLREPSVLLCGKLNIEMHDVVVPTAEEWVAVK